MVGTCPIVESCLNFNKPSMAVIGGANGCVVLIVGAEWGASSVSSWYPCKMGKEEIREQNFLKELMLS